MITRDRGILILNKVIEYTLYVLIFLLPSSVTAVEICASIMIGCWLFRRIVLEKWNLRPVYTELNVPLVLFGLIALLSFLWSSYPAISLNAAVCKISEYILLFFIVAEVSGRKGVMGNAIKALAAAAVFICIDGLYQKFTGHDFIRGYPLHSAEQITGPFKFPNGLGAWLLIAVFPFLSLAFYCKKNLRLKAGFILLSLLLVSSFFFAYTRGVIFSFVLGLLLLTFLKKKAAFFILCALLIAGLLAVALSVPQDESSHRDLRYYTGLSKLFSGTSSQHRLRIWATGWRMFLDRPFLGQGFNTFMANYERFRVPGEEGIWYAHNCFLQIAAESGAVGLLLFLWMIVNMVVVSLRSWRKIEDELLKYFYLGLFCGIVSFLALSSVDVTIYSLRLAALFYLSLGLLMGTRKIGLSGGDAVAG